MHHFKSTELTDMHVTYGAGRGNNKKAHHIYQGQHPRRHLPHHTTFVSTGLRIQEWETLRVRKPDSGSKLPRLHGKVCTENWQ
jgi:hypothetical protein